MLSLWIVSHVVFDVMQHLERSRSKFKRFAVKYERELEQVCSRTLIVCKTLAESHGHDL